MKKSGKVKLDAIEKRYDWTRFAGYARMHVSVSGGPIHAPHERVLQILIQPWFGDHESWTVYRHESNRRRSGKIVFKKWDYHADKERFKSLGQKQAPSDWCTTTSVTEKHFVISANWVKTLETAVGDIRVPPITGPLRPLNWETVYTMRLWRMSQESEFSWSRKAPAGWQPLATLFSSLLHGFRHYEKGKFLPKF